MSWRREPESRAIVLTLNLKSGGSPALRVLCLGAHCDDIDLGCGGTLLKLIRTYPRVSVTWVVFSSNRQRAAELRRSARMFLRGAAEATVIAHEFRDGYFPAGFAAIKDRFEQLKAMPTPDLVFTHHLQDRHQDHRVVSELTWNTFRSHCVLEYEIPKYDGGLTTPNVHFELSQREVGRKVRILLSAYKSQLSKRWFTEDTFRSILRLRGIESGAQSGWAEGFHGTKLLLG